MFKLFLALFLILSSLFGSNKYILVEEYLKSKQNRSTFDNFITTIKNSSVPIFKEQSKPIKIYMIYPGEQISDYWRRSKVSFEARLKELNIKYELVDYFTKPTVQLGAQAQALFDALQDDTDYLVFTLDANKHYKFISVILNKNKPKLILQNITTPLKSFNSKQPLLYDGFDHVLGSKILANHYMKTEKKGAKYAVMYGPVGYVSSMRGDQFIKYISSNSDFKLLDSYYTDFNKDKAKLATIDLVENHKDIDFIYACSTDIALGVIEGLKITNKLGQIRVNGWGGGSSEIESLLKKELDFTVMRMNDDNGVAMAEAIKYDLEGKTSKIPLIFSGEFNLIKQDTAIDELNKLEKRAFRYSGTK